MSVHKFVSPRLDPILEAKIHLAAAMRMATLHELDEGIDNHFTMAVPGREGQYLILPFGYHWSEARASDMIIFDETGRTIEGDDIVEMSALCIHAPIHRITGAKVVLHTHQTWTLALNMLQDNRLLPLSQTAAFQVDSIVYDDHYTGIADTLAEGERLAHLLGTGRKAKPVCFMKNHGVLVIGETMAQAYRRLYRIERVCRNQLIAMSANAPLALLDREVVQRVEAPNPDDRHTRAERERLFFEAMMRVVDRELPGYRD
jgi:ribulose-5-phosphate 4-epimerase/fuculose-1-phosphate aldolase